MQDDSGKRSARYMIESGNSGGRCLSSYSQTDQPLKITTPLGPDILLLRGVKGHEEMSRLFGFHVDMVADRKDEVHFDQIIGQGKSVGPAGVMNAQRGEQAGPDQSAGHGGT